MPYVLFVEDNDVDAYIMTMAMEECLPSLRLSRFSDGDQAVQFFQNLLDQPMPDLVFLDVNMPRLDGFDMLQFMRAYPPTNAIPVVVFTCSANAQDRKKALELGANDFITKPFSFELVMQVLTDVCLKHLGRWRSPVAVV